MQADFSEFCVERGAPPLPDGEMIHESPWLNLYLYPARARLPALACPSDPTWHNLESSVRTTDAAVERPAGARRRRRVADLRQPRLAGIRRRAADAEAWSRRWRTRRTATWSPRGPSTTEYELAGQHGGRGVPAAGLGPAAGRPGDHPRRQQHDDRVPPLRQADGRAADLLGPARQRPADRRDGLRRSGLPTYSFGEGDLAAAIDGLLADRELRASLRGCLEATAGESRAPSAPPS